MVPDTGKFSTWRNVIIWNCTHNGANDERKSIDITTNAMSDTLLHYCCIDDGFPLDSHVAYSFPTVIDTNPMFANETERAFQLRIDSPCVDAGNSPPVPTDALDADLDLITLEKSPDQQFLRRVFDDPAVTDTGVGNSDWYGDECGTVDIGAFERQTHCESGVQGDYDGNGLTNGLDIQPFVHCYLSGSISTLPCSCSDINMDGLYTLADVSALIDILLGRRWAEVANDCPTPHEGGEGEEGEGERQGMMASASGGGKDLQVAPSEAEPIASAESEDPPAETGGDGNDGPEEVEDPAFTARWNAFVAWLDANWIDQYQELTEEQWNAMTIEVMIDMVYEGVAP